MDSFGDNLRQFRRNSGYTQKEFAKILHVSEVSIIRYEKHQRDPSPNFIKQLKINFPEIDIAQMLNVVMSSKDNPKHENTGDEMYKTNDGYYIYRDPCRGLLTRVSVEDSDKIEVRINGEWVPDKVPLPAPIHPTLKA